MVTIDELIDRTTESLRRELEEDIVGPWEIFSELRFGRAEWSHEEIWSAAGQVLRRLAAAPGIVFGDFDRDTGAFITAEDQEEALAAAAREWRTMDRDPAPAEIGYLCAADATDSWDPPAGQPRDGGSTGVD